MFEPRVMITGTLNVWKYDIPNSSPPALLAELTHAEQRIISGELAALLPVLEWLLRQHAGDHLSVQSQWADLRRLRNPPRTLALRIAEATRIYQADLLFVHRDAEGRPALDRHAEIAAAVEEAKNGTRTEDERGAVRRACDAPLQDHAAR